MSHHPHVRGPAALGLAALAAAALVLAGGGIASAYWTTTGTGSGTVTVAGRAPALTLHVRTAGTLVPGTSVAVHLSADNPAPAGQRVGVVHLTAVTADADHARCPTADFSMADVTVDQLIPARHRGVALAATGMLRYRGSGPDETACAGATLTLHVDSH